MNNWNKIAPRAKRVYLAEGETHRMFEAYCDKHFKSDSQTLNFMVRFFLNSLTAAQKTELLNHSKGNPVFRTIPQVPDTRFADMDHTDLNQQ